MEIVIIKENKLNVFKLPENVVGNYWITDYENGRKINMVNIEASSDGWKLISNDDAFIVDNQDIMIPNVILQNYHFYSLQNNFRHEKYYLYCSPVYDNSYKEFGVNNESIIHVGNSSKNEICYNLGGISEVGFTINKKDNYYYLTVNDDNSLIFVNQNRVNKSQRILYGDIIFWYGLKLILMKHDGIDYFLINNPGGLLAFNAAFVNVVPQKISYNEDYAELNDESLNFSKDYFYRTPYFYQKLSHYILQIDAPPTKVNDDGTPEILTIGPMLTMSMMSVVMLMSTMNSIGSGERTFDDSWTSIAMCVVMLASSLLWPMLTRAYQKFSNKNLERKRQKLYMKYLTKKEKEILNELEKQRQGLIENNFSISQCQDIIKGHNVKLWQKRITDDDFLTLPIGIGNLPMQIEIKYPEEHFSLDEDNLLDEVHKLGQKERILKDVPITYSFYDNVATGIVGNYKINKDFIDRLILQIVTRYSYDEVKIVLLTSMENEAAWDYVKVLPHCWSNDKTFRYFASSNDEYREIAYNLEKVFQSRVENDNDARNIPHYIIITDAIKSVDNYDLIKNVLSNGENIGFSMVMLVDRVSACPNECKNFINLNKSGCYIFNSVINLSNQQFVIDESSVEELYNCAVELANIEIELKNDAQTSLPDVYHYLEMYQVGKVEHLNSFDRWKKSNPVLSLQAPVGIGKSGEIISLDLHERYHGPHGLIAGTTGSGKSEFIITFVLSLAINYSPYDVQIILIDYKGGSLAGAFKNDKYVLPHLAGTITNLDGNELNRSLASIESEVKRRQKEFNDAKVVTNESTMDIYKYQKLWKEGRLVGKEPISHLFIISDEFAELKEQQPDFMDKLISVARVGRSLGIHLILATQKPGGVVDQQIWSNTRFRVCLKVQDTGDSQEVLKKPDAAFLKKTGRFYLQVGYDEIFTLGQSAWAGGQYYPSVTFKKQTDNSVNAINNIGFVTMSKDNTKSYKIESQGEELTNIVKYLSDLAISENIKIHKLWLDKIPAKIYVDALKSKYNYLKKDFDINLVIGEYDDPNTQNQYLLTIPLTKYGNAILYGTTGSGKDTFISTMIYSGVTSYSPLEINYYILDFGSETLGVFKNVPHVGDVAYLNDTDKIINLFKMVNEMLVERKKLFSSFGGTYEGYNQNSGKNVPAVVVIINNYESFLENFEDLNEQLASILRESYRYGIYFVISASSETSVRVKIKQNISLTYALQQNNDSDYANIFGNIRGKTPAKIKGRGLFKKENVYEFQTAYSTDNDNFSDFIKNLGNELSKTYVDKALPIPSLPDRVSFDDVIKNLSRDTSMAIGLNKNTLETEKYNFGKSSISLISSYEIEKITGFLQALIREFLYVNVYDILILNGNDIKFDMVDIEKKIYNSNYDSIINKVADYVDKVYDIYQGNGFNDASLLEHKKLCVFICGINDFINKLSDELKKKFSGILQKNNQMNLVSFVIVDNPDVIKTFAYDEWFKVGTDTSKGIFVGSGIDEQNLFKVAKITREDREEIPIDFGFIINNSKLVKIKLLSTFEQH